MPKFKAVKRDVQAEQLTADNAEELALWCLGVIVVEHDPHNHTTSKAINYPTFYGTRRVSEGQYLVKDQDGFSTIGAATFAKKFIEIQEPEDHTPPGTKLLDEADSALTKVFGPRQI